MTTLYEISAEYQKVFDEISQIDGITDEIISDTLAPVITEFNDKAINITSYFKNLEAQSKAIQEAEKMMYARRKSLDNKVERLKNYLKTNMEMSNINKIECPYFSISLRKCKDKVEITKEENIPNEFIREKIIREPDKDKILKAGGCKGAEIKESWALVIK